MRPSATDRPYQVVLIACFQFMKAGFLLTVAAFLWIAPNALPNSMAFSHMLFIAAHGRDVSGYLIPVIGLYVAYVGCGIYMMRPSVRQTLAISSAITVALSLKRLGLFGGPMVLGQLDRETLYILILLDLTIYLYLAFHPETVRSFESRKRPRPLHS
jgi:hypothetical protein